MSKLLDAENERITILMEECGETVQIAAKTQRHGFESYNPFDPETKTNRELLRAEIIDILGIVALMVENEDIDEVFVDSIIQESKEKRRMRYTHYQ